MVTATTFIPVLKYGFLTLVVSCAGYLIASITVFKHINGESLADLLVRHQMSMQADGVAGVLDKGFERCLTHPSNVFCLMTDHEHFGRNASQTILEILSIQKQEAQHPHPVFEALRSLSALARNLTFRPVLLEPSLLFCLLNPTSKTLLLAHGFNPVRFQGPRNSLLLGIDEEAAQLLGKGLEQIRGFMKWEKLSKDHHNLPDRPQEESLPFQFTFHKSSAAVYASVFYRRNGYLWRNALQDANHLPLIRHGAAFENFTAVRVPTKLDLDLYVPSDPVHFLFQMESSPFSACPWNASAAPGQPHPTLTREQLENRAAVALQEIKTLFHPYMVRFWLWGESLSGLKRDCNIFGKVSDLNIAALNTDLEKLNFTEIFSGNEFLSLIADFTVVDNKVSKIPFECHGLGINMFVGYEDGEFLAFYEDVDGNTEWVNYYKPKLVSTDVFGQIVYFPEESRVSSKKELH